MALVACSGGGSEALSKDGTFTVALTPATAAVFVGEHTSLTPVFDGARGSIDGIGRVQSGVAVEKPPLSTELFDPATGRWSAGPALNPAFYAAIVTMLSNGKVLVLGGEDAGGWPQAAAALFE